jgi:hypothetical protein
MTQTPLAETIARITAPDLYLYTDVGDLGADWVRADELVRADAPHLYSPKRNASSAYLHIWRRDMPRRRRHEHPLVDRDTNGYSSQVLN